MRIRYRHWPTAIAIGFFIAWLAGMFVLHGGAAIIQGMMPCRS